jgi:hypothetical protein
LVSSIAIALGVGMTSIVSRAGGSTGSLPFAINSESNLGMIYLIVYLIFAHVAIGCIIYNSIRIKKSTKKGKFITGLVFSIISTVIAFSFAFGGAMISLSSH